MSWAWLAPLAVAGLGGGAVRDVGRDGTQRNGPGAAGPDRAVGSSGPACVASGWTGRADPMTAHRMRGDRMTGDAKLAGAQPVLQWPAEVLAFSGRERQGAVQRCRAPRSHREANLHL